MATKFIESGTAATQDFSFYTAGGGTGVRSSSTQAVNGSTRSFKCALTNLTDYAYSYKSGILADAGRRITCYVRFDKLPVGATDLIMVQKVTTAAMFSVGWDSSGNMRLLNSLGASVATGSSVLAINTDYRISVAYTITSSSVNTISVYLNGVLELSATNINTSTGSDTLMLGAGPVSTSNYAASANIYFAHIYVDDGTSGDVGNVLVTAKRPNANGTTNNFVTQIGAGGSGYGTGHSPQVNERPLSLTNGWSIAASGSAVTEEYNIESAATGDVNISANTLVDYAGWVYAKSLSPETAQIILNNVTSNVSLTSSATLFTAFAASATYPAGTGTDVGLVTDTTVTTVSLYEAGIVFAYLPTAPTITSTSATWKSSTSFTGAGNVTSDGGEAITERGIVVGTSANPTTSNSKFTTSGTTGSLSVDATGLTAGTLYHMRAYATNSIGTSYGTDLFIFVHQQQDRLLLEDNVSFLLLEDNSSKLLLDETVELDAPLNAGTVTSVTPALSYFGKGPTSENLTYEIEVDTVNTFDSQAGGFGPQTLRDSYVGTPNSEYGLTGGSGLSSKIAEGFTPTASYSISQIDLLLFKSGAPSDNLSITVAQTTVTGTIIGTSANVATSSLSTDTVNGAFASFTFSSPVAITNGNKYFIILNRTATDATNRANWKRDNSNGYAGGGAETLDSGVWSGEHVANDVMFKVFGEDASFVPLLDKTSDLNIGFADATAGDTVDSKLALETTNGGGSLLLEDNSSYLILNQSFPSDDYVIYNVPTATLSNGVTYYWRVRRDPVTAGLAYGEWSEIRSFTVSTGTSITVTQVAANVTASGGTQVVASSQFVAISQVAASVTAAGGTQVVQSFATVAQVAASVTATGGTQAIATVNIVSITQVAGTVTASGGTQVVATSNFVAIAQVAATVTASGGTQVVQTNAIIAQVAASVTATGGTQVIATSNFVAITQVAGTVTASGGTQVVAAVQNASIAQVAASVTATGGTQTVATVNIVAITQVAGNVTATGGTQLVQSNSTITQVAATVTATGGTQLVQSLASIAQVAANVTASGGTQVITTVNNVSITQIAGSVTASGGTQVIATSNFVAITQIAGNVTATGGTQVVSTVTVGSVAITQLAGSVTATGGTQAIDTVNIVSITQIAGSVTASGGTQAIATINDVAINQLAGSVTASGGTQVIATSNFVAITQLAGSVTASGGTQSLTAQIDAAIAQLAANVTATGGTQSVSASSNINNASIDQVGASVIATGGLQVITTSTGPLPRTSGQPFIFLVDGQLAVELDKATYIPV